jgi:hypothetical protein
MDILQIAALASVSIAVAFVAVLRLQGRTGPSSLADLGVHLAFILVLAAIVGKVIGVWIALLVVDASLSLAAGLLTDMLGRSGHAKPAWLPIVPTREAARRRALGVVGAAASVIGMLALPAAASWGSSGLAFRGAGVLAAFLAQYPAFAAAVALADRR